jgi:multiple sugar transport system ATP-binding protein
LHTPFSRAEAARFVCSYSVFLLLLSIFPAWPEQPRGFPRGVFIALASIELRKLAKVYPGRIDAVRPIDLSVESGELMVFLGPSGSGKSTILRLIAGLERPTAGRVFVDGRDMNGVPPHRRDVAMVFQNPALYPHLSVFGNLVFGVRGRGVSRAQARARVNQVSGVLGLDRVLGRKPSALSGGERQRVAIGRALVREPRIVLFDEPFSNLDVPLRAGLREQVLELHRRFKTTLIHVTHDQSEALLMGDRVVVLDKGQLRQCDAPRAIYDRPAHRFVATFVGSPPMNLLPCQIERDAEATRFRPVGTERVLYWDRPVDSLPRGWGGTTRIFDLGIRPEAISVRDTNGATEHAPDMNIASMSARIRRLEFNGPELLATLAVGPHRMIARLPSSQVLEDGQRVEAVLDLRKSVWFDQTSGEAVS